MEKPGKKIPLDILAISKLFPVINYQKRYGIDCETNNIAKGEIEKLNYPEGLRNQLKVGEKVIRLTWDEKRIEYDTTWIHLGKDYFKQISKTYSRNC
jgi:hypothetical protein